MHAAILLTSTDSVEGALAAWLANTSFDAKEVECHLSSLSGCCFTSWMMASMAWGSPTSLW